jgi:hypothetical protein
MVMEIRNKKKGEGEWRKSEGEKERREQSPVHIIQATQDIIICLS